MMKKLSLVSFAVALLSLGLNIAMVETSHAAANPVCNKYLLTFPAWYNNLAKGDGCSDIVSPTEVGGIQNFILIVVMNCVGILMQLVVYITVGFIIWGGFKYMTSNGDASGIAGAKKMILNAVIGLVIAMLAIAIVTLVSGNIK